MPSVLQRAAFSMGFVQWGQYFTWKIGNKRHDIERLVSKVDNIVLILFLILGKIYFKYLISPNRLRLINQRAHD